ncbi:MULTISPECIES: ArsR/SmtB family transcription factor [unclassified Nocardioides]|uniref:ArsR/SmtB family transcription factor n=1 Tax=unclassified Nocardioides TaxID=2615069 RepID=UPI003FA5A1E0
MPSVLRMTSIETLRAVHHPTRRRIMEYLGVHGPSQVTTLAGALDEQVGSISHHLRMLERVEIVERAPELSTDGRTSWWRTPPDNTITWSVDDFADNPADRMQAKAAEKLNVEFQIGKLAAWKRSKDRADAVWREAAFSSDTSTLASADELAELSGLLQETVRAWVASIDRTDGRERQPVFVFAHGFPTRP